MSKRNQTGYKPSLLDDIFGRPPLLKGEDRDKYEKLQAVVSESLCPEDLFDEIDAREITSALWEGQLYRKMFQKLVDSKRPKAFEILTSERFGHVTEEQENWIESLGGEPYPDGMTTKDVLKKVGLSLELLQANAVLMAQEEIPHLERLIEKRIATRNARLNDLHRRKRSRAKIDRSDDEDEQESKGAFGNKKGAFGKKSKDSS